MGCRSVSLNICSLKQWVVSKMFGLHTLSVKLLSVYMCIYLYVYTHIYIEVELPNMTRNLNRWHEMCIFQSWFMYHGHKQS